MARLDPGAIEEARAVAADLALVDSSPDEILARIYEAATERALDHVMKQIRPLEQPRFEPPPAACPRNGPGSGRIGFVSPAPAPGRGPAGLPIDED